MTLRVLVVEDGHEYTETLTRFLADGFAWTRAGSGGAALALLTEEAFDAVFLDMRFDRVPVGALLGDLEAATARFGDEERAVQFLMDNQGTVILTALRNAQHRLPVLMSYAFDEEPRRFERLAATYGPVDYVPDAAGPTDIRDRLHALTTGRR